MHEKHFMQTCRFHDFNIIICLSLVKILVGPTAVSQGLVKILKKVNN